MTRVAAGIVALLALLVLALTSAPAHAELASTAQARAANAEFLVTAVPPGPSAAVCQVDTGVDVNADTAHVVDRLAIGEGEIGDASPTKHGTMTAMMMGAGVNGFGMVGIWPAVRIVSVRANIAGQDAFTPPAYIHALMRCSGIVNVYGVKVVELALASATPLTEDEIATLSDVVATARASGINVVAGAGNNAGGPVFPPANIPGVLSVGGSGADGQLCSTSAAGAVLQGPGCGLDAADPVSGQPLTDVSGTSGASAIVAAALAAIRTWRPNLDAVAAEQVLKQTAKPRAGGPLLDVAAAFRELGLGAVVETNQPAQPLGQPPQQPAGSLTRDLTEPRRLARPRVRVRRTRGIRGLLVTVLNRPKGIVTAVSAYRRGGRGVRSTSRRSSRVTIRIGSWDQLRVSFVDPSGRLRRSRAAIVNRRASPAART